MTACAGSDSGRWSDWHSASGASIAGSTMRDCQAPQAATTSRAIDSGRMVAPSPSAMTAVSVLADSISATTRGAMPAPHEGLVDHLAHDVVGARQVQVHLAQIGQRHGLGRRRHDAGPDQEQLLRSSGRNVRPCTVALPP